MYPLHHNLSLNFHLYLQEQSRRSAKQSLNIYSIIILLLLLLLWAETFSKRYSDVITLSNYSKLNVLRFGEVIQLNKRLIELIEGFW